MDIWYARHDPPPASIEAICLPVAARMAPDDRYAAASHPIRSRRRLRYLCGPRNASSPFCGSAREGCGGVPLGARGRPRTGKETRSIVGWADGCDRGVRRAGWPLGGPIRIRPPRSLHPSIGCAALGYRSSRDLRTEIGKGIACGEDNGWLADVPPVSTRPGVPGFGWRSQCRGA